MALQGSSPNLQGGGISLQGSTYPLQGGNINLQQTPARGITINTNPAKAAQTSVQPPDYNALLAAANAAAQQAAYAPALNLGDIYNQASTTAQGAVNPYYTKQLSDFQTQQAQSKALQQQQTQMNIQNLQTQLANTLQGNQITQGRTAQDVLGNEQQIGIKADQAQQDQGTQFDQARIAQAKQLASQGLTTSGTGAQQVLGSQTDRNTQEGRQAADVAQQQQAQELFKTRTFEDLARSGDLATKQEATGETQANFDLNKFILGQAADLQQQTQSLEQQRLSRVAQETQNQAKLLVNNFIQSLSNPAQRLAAAQQYGGAF